eukprot:TRINITY_DN35007_c0_g1_i3.p1 TRINITY_DN35007_c0_g1~~TRINITY_DN35007_c0_g1_i3.p1  ORF type:complete len:307 (+),score=34.64 TRINITY_DN35007_c0_g1_i3:238-1158(+)
MVVRGVAAKALTEYAREHRWERALSLLDDLLRQRAPVSVFDLSRALGACASRGQWRQAFHALHGAAARRLKPDAVCFNSVIAASARNIRWQASTSILVSMASFEVQPTSSGHNAVLAAFALSVQWARGLQLLERMGAQRLETDAIAWGSVIKACTNAQKWKMTLGSLNDMKTLVVQPDEVAFHDVVSSLEQGGALCELSQETVSAYHQSSRSRSVALARSLKAKLQNSSHDSVEAGAWVGDGLLDKYLFRMLRLNVERLLDPSWKKNPTRSHGERWHSTMDAGGDGSPLARQLLETLTSRENVACA